MTDDAAEDLANKMSAEYWKCSAKTSYNTFIKFVDVPTDENVKELFERLAVVLFEGAVLRVVNMSKEELEIGSSSLFGIF